MRISETLNVLMQTRKFEQALNAIATYVFATSVWFNDRAVFYYFGKNGLDVAPDILARSGILEWGEKNRFCDFTVDWQPGQPLSIVRNEHEATESELEIAMVHAIRWNSIGTDSISIPTQFFVENPIPGPELCSFALREIAECLTSWELGKLYKSHFTLNKAGQKIPEFWKYWSRANLDRRHVNATKQNTKTHTAKNYSKYEELYNRY